MGFLDNAVLLSIEFHSWGIRRKVSSSAVQTDAEKRMLAVSKKLIESDAYDAIIKRYGKIRQQIDGWGSGAFFLRPGIKVLSLELVQRAEDYLTGENADVKEMAREFARHDYAPARDEAERLLGSLFRFKDYPSADRVAEMFFIEWYPIEFSAPGKLQRVSATALRQAEEKLSSAVDRAEEEIRMALRGEMLGLVEHLRDKLNGLDNGAVKRFHDSSVTNVTEFLQTVRARNITGDSALIELCDQAQALMKGVTVDGLKDSRWTRDRVGQGFEAIKTSLSAMVEELPARRIKFGSKAA